MATGTLSNSACTLHKPSGGPDEEQHKEQLLNTAATRVVPLVQVATSSSHLKAGGGGVQVHTCVHFLKPSHIDTRGQHVTILLAAAAAPAQLLPHLHKVKLCLSALINGGNKTL